METQSQDNKHNSWQKKIVVHKVPFKKEDDKNNIYGTINREAMYKSLELLNFVEFKVYMFIATNKDGYDFKLSTKYISNKIRTDQRNVQRAMNGLLEKGFIIKNENGGFDFYEDKNLAINDADGQNKATISVSESDTNCINNVHYDRKSRHSNHPNNQLNNQLNNQPNNLGADAGDAAGAAKERTDGEVENKMNEDSKIIYKKYHDVPDVDLFGDTVVAAQDKDGVIWAGVRWICNGLGLSKGQMQSERKKIQEDVVLSLGERNLILPTSGGKQDVLCLQLDYIPLWLAKISITPNMKENNPELVHFILFAHSALP